MQVAVNGMDGDKRSHLLPLCCQLLKQVLTPCHIAIESSQWIRTTALSYAAEMDGRVLGTLCAVTMALLTNRLDLCIQGLFGAGKSKSMAILILALLELHVEHRLKILFLCKENSGTRSFADLLQWLDPPEAVLKRLGRLVGDQERTKSSYSYTKFDINPRERRQMLGKCQLVMATGGTVSQDLTMQWSTMSGFMQDLSLMVIDEGQQTELTERLPQLAFFGLSPSYYGLEMHNRPQEVLLVRRPTRNCPDSYSLPNNTALEATGDISCRQPWPKPWSSSWKTHPMRACAWPRVS